MPGPQPLWDVFHSDRLEAERSLTTDQVLNALAKGDLVEDDLVRQAGDTRWTRIGDSLEFGPEGTLNRPDHEAEFPMSFDTFDPPSFEEQAEDEYATESELPRFMADVEPPPVEEDDDQGGEFEFHPESAPPPAAIPPLRPASSVNALPILPDEEIQSPSGGSEFEVVYDDEWPEELEFDPQDEDDEAAEFTLSRNAAERVEELDLAAMVDVAFQLVLFFLVTAQVVLFKTLEIPRPNEDKPPEAAAQARSKSVDELEKDYILVEVDAAGSIKVDHQPVNANRPALVERLRTTRDATARKAMLLAADFATQHKNAVLVFDVANEIELKIAIAQPSGKK